MRNDHVQNAILKYLFIHFISSTEVINQFRNACAPPHSAIWISTAMSILAPCTIFSPCKHLSPEWGGGQNFFSTNYFIVLLKAVVTTANGSSRWSLWCRPLPTFFCLKSGEWSSAEDGSLVTSLAFSSSLSSSSDPVGAISGVMVLPLPRVRIFLRYFLAKAASVAFAVERFLPIASVCLRNVSSMVSWIFDEKAIVCCYSWLNIRL